MVAGSERSLQTWTEEELRQAALQDLASGLSPSQTANRLAGEANWPKRKVYKLVMDLVENPTENQ